jgi:hypothetical protein
MQLESRTRRLRCCGLSAISLRQSLIFQPLAVLLAILILPALSWMDSSGTQRATGPFQAQAQTTVGGCASTTNSIIQNYCVNGVGYYNDLVQLESDAVGAYLATHNLPAGDRHVIYDYGRTDLRNSIRAYMISILRGIILKAASSRSHHEQSLYIWLQSLVQQNEIAYYTDAYNHYLSWQANPCKFGLDTTIANAYGMNYDGNPFCYNSYVNLLSGPPVPAPSYFLAYGLVHAYADWAGKCPLPVLPDVSTKIPLIIGSTVGAGLVGLAGGALYANMLAAQAAYQVGLNEGLTTGGLSVYGDFAISGEAVEGIGAVGTGALAGGVAAIVLLAIAIGVSAGFQAFNNQQMINQLNDLNNQIATNKNTPPDLTAFVNDTTGIGIFKIENTFLPQTLHANADGTLSDMPSTAPLPAHQPATDVQFSHESAPTSDALSYQGWNGEIWTAQTWGGWFVQTCADGTQIDSTMTGKCAQTDSISADLNFVNFSFAQWLEKGSEQSTFTASRFQDVDYLGNARNRFTVTRAAGDTVSGLPPNVVAPKMQSCPVGIGSAHISQGPYTSQDSACWNYVSNQLPIVLGDGTRDVATLLDPGAPSFSQPTNLVFNVGFPSTQTITIRGNPTPSGCFTSSDILKAEPPDPYGFITDQSLFRVGGLPISYLENGCRLTNSFGGNSLQVSYDGNLKAVPGDYSMLLRFYNSYGEASQRYTIHLGTELAIVSPGSMNVTAGVPASFTVIATGSPKPTLSVDPLFAPDLGGLNFHDNGDGTATISGVYGSVFTETCTHQIPPGPSGSNCGIIATIYNPDNTIKQQVEQQFAINVAHPPAARIATPGVAFPAGAQSQVLLSSTGATTPVAWCFGIPFVSGQFPLPCAPGPPLPWLRLQDLGNGTAMLSGTPPVGTKGPVTVNIVSAAAYTLAGSQQYTITVTDAPAFTTPNSATFTVGTNGSYTVSATEGTISLADSLPPGLQFSPNGNRATISGTPATGTGGQYKLSFTTNAGTLGTASQDLLLNVNEAPKITSAATATMFVGRPGMFAVTAAGFPGVSNHMLPANPQAPTDPWQLASGMYFTVTGLPQTLQASNLNPQGFAGPTLTIQGTPAVAGTYPVQITVQNGVGQAAQQTLILNIVQNPLRNPM